MGTALSTTLLTTRHVVFDLPENLLSTLQLRKQVTGDPEDEPKNETKPAEAPEKDNHQKATSCSLCQAKFESVVEQRRHVRSDWHGYNVKQRLRGLQPIDEAEFDRLIGDLDSSISGSDSSSFSSDDGRSDDVQLSTLLKKQARLHKNSTPPDSQNKESNASSGRSPLIWFSSPHLPPDMSLGAYRVLLTRAEQDDSNIVDAIRNKQIKPVTKQTTQGAADKPPTSDEPPAPTYFLCMIGGGHFAAMVVSLTPRIIKRPSGVEERQAQVLAHKTFHRYTTRRKQGGAQSANDSAKGAAHSAGASIRRHNEIALEQDIRTLLSEWRTMINECQSLFIRATGTTNRRILFGPYENQVLQSNDSRIRSFPFNTRRATQAELMRAFVELTRAKVSKIEEPKPSQKGVVASTKPLAAPTTTVTPDPAKAQQAKQDEVALLHTSQLQALIRRSKASAVVGYLASNSLSADFNFQPTTAQSVHHAPTPLHSAASFNSPAVVLALLTKSGSDPTVRNGEGRTPFDIAGDRATRDAFRIARSEIGEEKWNWEAAHCLPPLTKEEAAKRSETERAQERAAEHSRRQADAERLEKERRTESVPTKGGPRTVTGQEMSAADQREQQRRGLPPELRAKLERERRARAAEERIKRMTGA